MNKFHQLHWPLVIGLGALALVRPLMSTTGLLDLLGRPAAPIAVTVGISLLWLIIVVGTRVRQPFLTLVCVGLTYGVFAILLSAILSPLLTGELMGPATNGVATISVLITNAIWGGIVGVVAALVQRVQPSTAG